MVPPNAMVAWQPGRLSGCPDQVEIKNMVDYVNWMKGSHVNITPAHLSEQKTHNTKLHLVLFFCIYFGLEGAL